MSSIKNPIPRSIQAWIIEIRAAYEDAAEAIPFGPLAGAEITASDLFQLAPVVTLKFRGFPRTKKNLKLATEAALCSYVATTSHSPVLKEYPSICFALAYLASHYGLDLVSEARVNQIMDYISANPRKLLVTRKKGAT